MNISRNFIVTWLIRFHRKAFYGPEINGTPIVYIGDITCEIRARVARHVIIAMEHTRELPLEQKLNHQVGETTHSGVDVNMTYLFMINPLNHILIKWTPYIERTVFCFWYVIFPLFFVFFSFHIIVSGELLPGRQIYPLRPRHQS